MRHGWVYIYESSPANARFRELVEVLSQNGIYLERPRTGQIARLSYEGERILCSQQDILNELAVSTKVNVQLYLDERTGLFCSIERLTNDIVRESYSLDGKTEQESLNVIQALTYLFIYRAERTIAFALVADRCAELYRDFHWDDFILGETSAPPEWPLLLGFAIGFPKMSAIPLDLYNREAVGNYLLFRRA